MNEKELGEKLNIHLKHVYAYLLKMGASKEDAEDVIQETAYKFLFYIDAIEIRKVESWLFRVAINLYYDLSRKQTRRRDILLTFEFEQLIDDYSPEKALLQKVYADEIFKVLDRLRPIYKQLLILKYSVGLKIIEIAELLDMKTGSIKTMLHRSRKQFIEEYRRFGYDQRTE